MLYLSSMRPPKQKRSEDTLVRLTAAAERLLADRHWSAISVADICRESGVVTGSFYARFDSKDALLAHLDNQYTRQTLSRIAVMTDEIAAADDLREAVATLVAGIHDFVADKPGVARALVLNARTGDRDAAARTTSMTAALDPLFQAFGRFAPQIAHTDWIGAISEAFAIAFHTMREMAFFPQSLAIDIPQARLRDVLNDVVFVHLTREATA